MRVTDTYNNVPREHISPKLACFINIKKEVYQNKFDLMVGDYIELELYSLECMNDLSLYNNYINLRIEFLRRYNTYYPDIPWMSIFSITTKNS